MMLLLPIHCAVGLAQTAADEEIVVEAPERRGTPTSQVTVIHTDEALTGSDDVASAVARAPGTVVRRLGGVGDLAQVGIRGAGSRQVEVAIDGVPLNPEGGSSINLAELPLYAFDRVEVYRGAAPPLIGTGAIGGTVNLVTGDQPQVSLSGSWGSWKTGRLTALASGSAGPIEGFVAVDGLTTGGDFRWYDDGNTLLSTADDTIQERANNDTRQLASIGRIRWGNPKRAQVSVLHGALLREEGLPGTAYGVPTTATRYGIHRHVAVVEARGAPAPWAWQARATGLWREETLDDRGGELTIGVPAWTRSVTQSVVARGAAQRLIGDRARVDSAIEAQLDAFHTVDRITGVASETRTRRAGRAVLGVEWAPTEAWAVTGTARGLGFSIDGTAPDWLLNPWVGARWQATEHVALKSNLGTATRPPDVIELFGDRGSLVGNPELRPERSRSFDIGAAVTWPSIQGEVVAFARQVRDLIQWLPKPTGVARAENIDQALVLGLEASTSAQRGPWSVSSTLSVTRALDTGIPSARPPQLPSVPILGGRIAAAWAPPHVRISTDLAGSTSAFRDPRNTWSLGPRLLWGATARMTTKDRRASLELDVRNLLDQLTTRVPTSAEVNAPATPAAMVDVSGYPLPGRTWLLTARIRR